MEILHVFRVRGKRYNEAIDDIKRLNVKINAPDSWVMIKALEYQMEYEFDPYDSIAFAVAQTAGCQIFCSRRLIISSILIAAMGFFVNGF